MNSKVASRIMLSMMILLLLVTGLYQTIAQPVGGTIIYSSTDNGTVPSVASLTTAGGSFTTLVLNVTQQNPRWKAYVGNVTGDLLLRDSSNYTIYDWNIATITGEVYASRNSTVDWGNIRCLTDSVLASEETTLNITTSAVDSINNTFPKNAKHKSFWVGGTKIINSSCRAIATYVNNTAQASSENATFQEILLDDTSNLIFATILEQGAIGYDSTKRFDFQMIVADDETETTPTTYYFYAEIG